MIAFHPFFFKQAHLKKAKWFLEILNRGESVMYGPPSHQGQQVCMTVQRQSHMRPFFYKTTCTLCFRRCSLMTFSYSTMIMPSCTPPNKCWTIGFFCEKLCARGTKSEVDFQLLHPSSRPRCFLSWAKVQYPNAHSSGLRWQLSKEDWWSCSEGRQSRSAPLFIHCWVFPLFCPFLISPWFTK